MSDSKGNRTAETAEQRRARLAAELRANLAKRKAQARARGRRGEPAERSHDKDGPGGGKVDIKADGQAED